MDSSSRLPPAAHTSRPWRIHEIAPDFRLEDAWSLPTPGTREDFPHLVRIVTALDPASSPSLTRVLWEVRWRLGQFFGWDAPRGGLGSRVETLRHRLPSDLRDRPVPEFTALPFESLYLLEDEFAAETANRTMHGILHLGWVSDGARSYRGQMAVLVKPNGGFGEAYMAAIRPFRHRIVYPAMFRQFERAWEYRRSEQTVRAS